MTETQSMNCALNLDAFARPVFNRSR
jgi:hypothetical protein